MKLVLLPAIAGSLLFLSACADVKEHVDDRDHVACRRMDAPTGSHFVRREDCMGTPSANADKARQDAATLQDIQRMTTPSPVR